MRSASLALVAGVLSAPFAGAASASTVSVTLPRLPLAEYKRPYAAGWIEPAAGGPPRSLFVWYDLKKGGNEPGVKWLADLRTWWRKAGRTMKLPADGVSGATRAPGTYAIPLPADLAPGKYVVSIEVARENGGRELVSVPVSVPNPNARGGGKSEVGAITVSAK